MFPLYITAPDRTFHALKRAGVPVYRRTLLHLPCHQSLTAAQPRSMPGSVAAVLA